MAEALLVFVGSIMFIGLFVACLIAAAESFVTWQEKRHE